MGSKVSELKNMFEKKMEDSKDANPKLQYKGSLNESKVKAISKS
jgi:hypothetical protein